MCDPVTLAVAAAATAATAGGSRLNQIASEKAVKQSVAQEEVRQHQYQGQADANFGSALSNFTPQNSQQAIANATTSRDNSLAGNLTTPDTGSYSGFTNNQPGIVQSGIAKTLSDSVARGKDQAQRLAALGATGDVMANNNIALDKAGSNAKMISGFANSSANVNSLERAAAAKTTTPWGDGLKLAGQAGSLYSLAGAPGAGSLFGGSTVSAPASSMFPWSAPASVTTPTSAANFSGLGGIY